MLIQYNPATRATPPKKQPPKVNYYQVQDVENIRNALESEPLKWRVLVHLLLITGARRGEIAGLKWGAVDFKNSLIRIETTINYNAKTGIYEDTPKTKKSARDITLPAETIELLKEYRAYWLNYRQICGSAWNSFAQIHNGKGEKISVKAEYLFFQEKTTDKIGYPMNPIGITKYCNDFAVRHALPHINPHAFRHTMASILYFNGVDSVSISGRLGHSQVSTTADIYSHIIAEADRHNAECIADVILRPKKA